MMLTPLPIVDDRIKHLDLFSGIGGFSVAARAVWGERYCNVAHADIEEFSCSIYHRNFPGSICLGDITKIDWTEERFDGINLITGGFPCQPHSLAGKRKASEDTRDLWSECVRALSNVRPRWALFENVPGLLTSEKGQFFKRVLTDLAEIGYDAEWHRFGAWQLGAPHKRDRIWIVCNPTGTRGLPDDWWEALVSQGTDSERLGGDTEGDGGGALGEIQSGAYAIPRGTDPHGHSCACGATHTVVADHDGPGDREAVADTDCGGDCGGTGEVRAQEGLQGVHREALGAGVLGGAGAVADPNGAGSGAPRCGAEPHGEEADQERSELAQPEPRGHRSAHDGRSDSVADPEGIGCRRWSGEGDQRWSWMVQGESGRHAVGCQVEGCGGECATGGGGYTTADWWAVEPRMGVLADGLPVGMDVADRELLIRVGKGIPERQAQVKAIGNAIVPACAMVFLHTMREVLDKEEEVRNGL